MVQLRKYQEELVRNLRKAICSGKKKVCAVLGCGGGKSVIQGKIAESATRSGNNVLFIVHRKELCQQIEKTFIECGVDMTRCRIGMIQTLCRRIPSITPPALILVDECHHILSESYKKVIEAFPDAVVLGFTATPVRMNEGGLGSMFQELVESVSTKWLIDNHFLSPYRCFGIPLADTSQLHTRHGEFAPEEVEELMNHSAIFGSAVQNWKINAQGKQTIVYCSSIDISKKTAEAFRGAGVTAAHLDGTTPAKEREEAVRKFRDGKIRVLCNVDLFGEGFDVPDCEAVVLLRPTQSLGLHIQQSMRPMRYKPGKTAIILDHVGNYTRHGLPDDVREWTLAQKKRKKRGSVSIRQCKNCFAIFSTSLDACPYCGMKVEKKEREEQKVLPDVILKEIQRNPYTDYRKCKTWTELDNFRKERKYKPGWSFYKAMELNIKIPDKYYYVCKRMGLRT